MVINAPLPDYIESWKAFRLASNENDVLGRYIASKLYALNGRGLDIMDIGTGDGKLLQSALFRCKEKPRKVTVLEPDSEFLAESQRNLSLTSLANEIEFVTSRLGEIDERYFSEHNFFLAAHVLYLIDWQEFEVLVQSVPPGSTILIIVDSSDSIFAEIWRETAPRHRERVDETLSNLNTKYGPRIRSQTVVQSKLTDPRHFRPDVKDLILSLLSYADVRDLDADTYSWIEDIVAKKAMDGYIHCDCLCMELTGSAA